MTADIYNVLVVVFFLFINDTVRAISAEYLLGSTYRNLYTVKTKSVKKTD